MQRITIETIESKEFSIKPRGYDREEVDNFLDSICDEIEQREKEMATLQQQLKEAQASLASRPMTPIQAERAIPTRPLQISQTPVQPFTQPKAETPAQQPSVPEDKFREILMMAQRVKDETIEEAQKKAEEIKAKAEEEASARLGNLSNEQSELTERVQTLKQQVSDYRERMEAFIREQQEALDRISDL